MGLLTSWVSNMNFPLLQLIGPATIFLLWSFFLSSFQHSLTPEQKLTLLKESSGPVVQLGQLCMVCTLDGKVLAEITHSTVPASLHIFGNHCEEISLYFIPSPSPPLVYGFPWLMLHNTVLNWQEGHVSSWSRFYYSTCLHSASSYETCWAYHDLAEALRKGKVLSFYHLTVPTILSTAFSQKKKKPDLTRRNCGMKG